MQKWEYKRITGRNPEMELNQLGAQGWELVAVAADCSDLGLSEIYFYFKRQISD
jgi:hypothetical protein